MTRFTCSLPAIVFLTAAALGQPPGGGRPDDQRTKAKTALGGIQWFATLEAGLAEAKRTQKPILYVSAAPHCGGISGIW